MPTLVIARAASNKQRVTLQADDGSILNCYDANLMTPLHQRRLIEATGLTAAAIATAALQVQPKGSDPVELPYTVPGSPEAAGPFSVIIRGRQETKDAGTTIERSTPVEAVTAALEVLDYPGAEPLIQWDGTDRLCVLDVDYHDYPFDARPSVHYLETRAAGLHPRPFAFHVSHGRGVKLFYAAQGGYTAKELAAVGAIGWRAADKRATFDLISQTRHPKYARPGHPPCGVVYTQTPGEDMQPVAVWLKRTADPAAVEDWLADRGWAVGMALPHTDCILDPCPTSSKAPVFVMEHGIKCQRCEAVGIGVGRVAGFVPYSSIIGGVPPKTSVMIANATHWSHARIVLMHETGLKESLLKPAYTAAVKVAHGVDSPQAAAVCAAGADLIRTAGRWVSPDGATTYTQSLHGMLNALPAVWVPGERTVSMERRDLFLQSGDLSHYGYPPITTIQGAKIFGKFRDYADDRIPQVMPAAWCRGEFAPRYREPSERLPLDKAWARIEEVFPKINRNYVTLLIALKGLAEGAVSQAPFVIVTGPSGSAKSSTVHVAASICGDVASEPLYTLDSVRLMQAIAGGLDAGSFVVMNELFKEAQKLKLKPRAAVDPILTLTPNAVAHRLYIGPRPLGKLPALVLTDVDVPLAVQADLQLARRLIWVEQKEKVDWEEPVAAAGFGEIGRYRLSSKQAAEACDAVLSDCIDRFFRDTWTVREIAQALEFGTLEDLGATADTRKVLRVFFDEVLKAPDLSGSHLERFPAPGWKVIERGDTSKLRDAWDVLADGPQGSEWSESRLVRGEDMGRVLELPAGSIAFDVAAWKGATFVRFRVGSRTAPTWTSAHGNEWPKFTPAVAM